MNTEQTIISMIDDAIEEELRYATDSLTNKGWDFLEHAAPDIVLNTIKSEWENELNEVDIDSVRECLQSVIYEFELEHGRIRDERY